MHCTFTPTVFGIDLRTPVTFKECCCFNSDEHVSLWLPSITANTSTEMKSTLTESSCMRVCCAQNVCSSCGSIDRRRPSESVSFYHNLKVLHCSFNKFSSTGQIAATHKLHKTTSIPPVCSEGPNALLRRNHFEVTMADVRKDKKFLLLRLKPNWNCSSESSSLKT